MPTLGRAIAIAAKTHRGQTDKAGMPYIEHPLHLMGKMRTENERIVAVLHDVVEDGDVTLTDLCNEGFTDLVVGAVSALTHEKDESYAEYVRRVKLDPTATRVKLADLEHNMDVTRLTRHLKESDLARIEKYHIAWLFLREADE